MIFAEKKTETGFNYQTEDLFGKMSIDSKDQLSKKELDQIILTVLPSNLKEGKIGPNISFTIERANQWEDDEDEIVEIEDSSDESILIKLFKSLKKFLWK